MAYIGDELTFSAIGGFGRFLGLAQFFFGAAALRKIGHGADQAQGVAIVIAHHVAAIQDVSVSAIAAAEAELIGPQPAPAGDGLLQPLHHPLAVAGMEIAGPPFHVGGMGSAVAEQLAHGVVEPQRVFFQVPVPDAIVRGLGEKLEALFRLAKAPLGALPLGDFRQQEIIGVGQFAGAGGNGEFQILLGSGIKRLGHQVLAVLGFRLPAHSKSAQNAAHHQQA